MRTLTSLATALVVSFSILSATGCATTGTEDGYAELDGEAALAGKLAFWQSPNKEWRFHLKSGNGAILLTSEGYVTRTGAIGGALSVLENGVDPAMYRVNQTATGYTLHLVAGNGESIGFSEVYATKSSATRAISSCVRAVTSYLDKREASSTGARVEVLRGEASGLYRFNVHAKNGEIVLSSEQYTTEAAAFNGAFAVQAEGQLMSNYEIKQNTAGGWYFVLQARNGEVIGVSEQYTTREAAVSTIGSLIKLLPTITVL